MSMVGSLALGIYHTAQPRFHLASYAISLFHLLLFNKFAIDGGQYFGGGGNTATNNEGGKDCEGVLAKTECELVFTTSDEEKEGEMTETETDAPTQMTDSPTDVVLEPTMSPTVRNATLDPTMFPSASPILRTAIPTKMTSQPHPTMATTFAPTTNVTILATNETSGGQAGKNAIELPNSESTIPTYLTFINFDHEDGALGLCEGDCNQDNDCKGRLQCFKRAENGGWRNMIVPGCEADENHPMKKVDYCYDPFASTATEIGRGEPDTDADPVIDNGKAADADDESSNVSPAPSVSSTTTEPTPSPVTDEPTTAEPSGVPTLSPAITEDSSTTTSAIPTTKTTTEEPTQRPTGSPVSDPPTAAPVTPEPSASPVSDSPTAAPVTPEPSAGPTASPVETVPTSSPTKGPTSEFIDNSEPNDPQGGYFNYDLKSDFGPKKWHKVKPQKTEEYNYWKEFKDDIKEDLDKNYCDSSAQQSPINVFDAGGTCLEYHQIRDRVCTIFHLCSLF